MSPELSGTQRDHLDGSGATLIRIGRRPAPDHDWLVQGGDWIERGNANPQVPIVNTRD